MSQESEQCEEVGRGHGDRLVASARATLDRVTELVGANLAERAGKKATTHRLLKLCGDVERNITTVLHGGGDDSPALHMASITELDVHVKLLAEAQAELPHWESVLAALHEPKSYDHLILVLAYKDVCKNSWGLTTMVIPEVADRRTPDLMHYRNGEAVCAIEVKSKRNLVDPTEPFPYKAAENLVKSAIDAASDQFRSDFPGILVIGGFSVPQTQTQLVLTAARRWFKRNPGRKRWLAAIQVCGFLIYDKRQGGVGHSQLTATLNVDGVYNPSYALGDAFELVAYHGEPIDVPSEYRRWEPDYILVKGQ